MVATCTADSGSKKGGSWNVHAACRGILGGWGVWRLWSPVVYIDVPKFVDLGVPIQVVKVFEGGDALPVISSVQYCPATAEPDENSHGGGDSEDSGSAAMPDDGWKHNEENTIHWDRY